MEFDSEFIKVRNPLSPTLDRRLIMVICSLASSQMLQQVTFDFISESSFGIAFNAVEDSAGEHARFLELVSRVLLQVNYNSFNPFRKFVRDSFFRAH